MKKLSLILAIVSILAIFLSACSNEGKEPVSSTIDTSATTNQPISDTVGESQNPEPIYVGMTEDELTKACEEMNDKALGSVLKSSWNYVFWLDENGYNAVAETEVVDGVRVITSIDRYKRVIATKEEFEAIDGASTSDITVQELVKRLGRPIGEDVGSSSYYKFNFLDYTGCFEYTVAIGYGKIHIESSETRLQINRETIVSSMTNKHSLQNVEFHRVLLDKDEDGNCKILAQGVHGENKALWSVSFNASESFYNQYFNYRRSEILYNAQITDEYDELFYATPSSLMYQIAYWMENDDNIIATEIN